MKYRILRDGIRTFLVRDVVDHLGVPVEFKIAEFFGPVTMDEIERIAKALNHDRDEAP